MCTVERAIEISVEAHRNQSDKSGESYVLHPLKLMLEMDTETEMKVAVLHDVAEDSPWTLEDLRDDGFSTEVVEAVKHLTKAKYLRDDELGVDVEDYGEFIDRVKENETARKVKLADIEHNMDLTRLNELGEEDVERLERYHEAWKELR